MRVRTANFGAAAAARIPVSPTFQVRGRVARPANIAVEIAMPITYPHYRKELVLPLQHVLMCGPVSRGEFKKMSGLADRTAQQSVAQLLRDGLLRSDGLKGSVCMSFPLDALNILFPNLYPEAATTNLDT